MEKVFSILAALLLMANVYAQSPEKMSYQAVIRNNLNTLVTNQPIGMRISILQGSANGTVEYLETQTPTTNGNGLVSIEIGGGAVVSGTFSSIDWANGPFFITTETDPTGGTTYTITGTSQLLSVPYALHAKTAETLQVGVPETDPIFGASVARGITGADTVNWNNKLDGYAETDPFFRSSVASEITEADTTNWNNKLDGYTETDPSVPTGTQTGDMQYWNGTSWKVLAATENEGATLQMKNGKPTWTGGTYTPNVTNPITGKVWMDRNLGASQVATSSTDTAAYGDLYQWGRGKDGHEIRTSDTTSILSNSDNPGHGYFIINANSPFDWRNQQNDNLWQGVNGINNPCPAGYRLPTEAEWDAERASWSTNNAEGAFSSPLKLPMAGLRDFTSGVFAQVGSNGRYWSSTIDGGRTRYLFFFWAATNLSTFQRAQGLSIRCIKD